MSKVGNLGKVQTGESGLFCVYFKLGVDGRGFVHIVGIMLTISTYIESNFKSDKKYVIQGTIARDTWVDSKHCFDAIPEAVKYAEEWIADNPRWMGGEKDGKQLRIVTSL